MKPEDRITLEHIHLAPAQLENLEGCLRAVPETAGITTAINALHTLKRALLAVKREHPLPAESGEVGTPPETEKERLAAAMTKAAEFATAGAVADIRAASAPTGGPPALPVEPSRVPVEEGAPVDTAAAPAS